VIVQDGAALTPEALRATTVSTTIANAPIRIARA
jgi:hypothetical protein